VTGNKIEKVQKKLMKKGQGLRFGDKKFGKESMLEKFAIQIVVVCGAIQGGGGFASRD
jgi:hypothetical protein